MPRSRYALLPALLAGLLTLVGCVAGGDVTRPVPTTLVAAPQPAHRLVVMLPGRGDSLQGLNDTGIAVTIQQSWPDADVLLTGLTMPFYQQGQAIERLHDEVIAPARRKGYAQVWLAGVSLGVARQAQLDALEAGDAGTAGAREKAQGALMLNRTF